jgi:hypothetical protein
LAKLPLEVVRAYIAEELPGAQAWAKRRGLELAYDDEQLNLRVPLLGSDRNGDPEHYLLEGQLDDYRVLPPVWQFLHPDTGEEIGSAAFPAPPSEGMNGVGSIFLPNGGNPAICARFSRLAYTPGTGPHPEWGELTGWDRFVEGQVYANTIGDMLHRIDLEVCASTERMEALP